MSSKLEVDPYVSVDGQKAWVIKGNTSFAEVVSKDNLDNATIEFTSENSAVIRIGELNYALKGTPVEFMVNSYFPVILD